MSAVSPPPTLQQQLSSRSTPYRDPLVRIPWERVDTAHPWMPEQALSVGGVGAFQELPEARRLALSHFEFMHLLQAGLWLEGIFLERLGRWAQRDCPEPSARVYCLHEIREEAGHSLMFLELIQRSGLAPPPSPFPHLALANLAGRHLPFRHAGFWLAVFIGESLPDRMNRFLHQHGTALCPAVHEMVHIHIVEEARHIAHARDTLERLLPGVARWQAPLLRLLTGSLLRRFADTLFYPGAALYEAAGLTPGTQWADLARANPQRRRFVDAMVEPVLRPLAEQGWSLAWR